MNRDQTLKGIYSETSAFSAGQAIIQAFAGWIVFQETGSAFQTGATLACLWLPRLIFGLQAGTIVDSLSPRSILIVGDMAGLAAIAAAILGRMYFPEYSVGTIAAMLFVVGTVQAFRISATQVLAYSSGDAGQEHRKMSVVNLLTLLSQSFGALAGGALLLNVGAVGTLTTAAVLIATSCGLAVSIRSPVQRKSVGKLSVEPADTLDLFRSSRLVRAVTLVTVTAEVFCLSAIALLPVVAEDQLGVGPTGLGLLQSLWSVGGLVGLQFLSMISLSGRRGELFLASSLLLSVGLILLAFSRALPLALLAVGLGGFCNGILDTLGQFLLQYSSAAGRRGAAMGIWVCCVGSGVLGMAMTSLAANWFPTHSVIGFNAAVSFVLCLAITAFTRASFKSV